MRIELVIPDTLLLDPVEILIAGNASLASAGDKRFDQLVLSAHVRDLERARAEIDAEKTCLRLAHEKRGARK